MSEESSISKQRLIALVLGPMAMLFLLMLSVPEGFTPEAWKLVALAAWMIIWWMTEAVPIPVTALLPIPMMPLLAIAPQKTVAASYGHPLIFLFLGGFMIAAAMQRWGLHRRIALRIVKAVGTSPEGIIGGFMVATALLSMWISNTATTIMMFAVGISIIEFVNNHINSPAQSRKFGVALMLGIAYSASIGGIGTLIGTPPNILLASFLSDNHGISIDFGTWMLMGVPLVIIMLPVAWFMLCKVIFPVKGIKLGEAGALIDQELEQLGEMSKGERIVLIVFVTTAIFWMTRQWIVSITGLEITDTSIALIAAILLFALPVSIERGHFTVEWDAAKNISWGVLILFGGGLALAGAFKSSGLAATIGNTVASMQGVEISMIILATIAAIIFLTEITSNTATTATFLPILGAVAVGLDTSPMLLTIPAALAASMAFMMPVATPPNAIVFSYEEMRIQDMIRAGIWLNIISIGLIYMAMLFLAPMVFSSILSNAH
ncbi:anion transporter [Candidatus Thiomargarita nelsonii]|uniref:Anion transporter n=1 Tax=Candidatus Thiomargarita nelsonii TaxID=1003181 RepID=A0A4E0QK11_9GAMM|nr:anion transporter [Candidatus Thiomargarita nelsonii]